MPTAKEMMNNMLPTETAQYEIDKRRTKVAEIRILRSLTGYTGLDKKRERHTQTINLTLITKFTRLV
jgi:hypothetical protein